MKRAIRWLGAAFATPFIAAVGACTVPAETDNCSHQLAEDEARVRTTRAWDEYLVGFANYLDIHWQAKALGDPCARMPGPTDWQYDMVLRLRHDEATRLAANLRLPPSAGVTEFDPAKPEIQPKLAPFVPAGVTWLHNSSWDAGASQEKGLRVWLDPAHDLAYVSLHDH